jgi:hypothetical protein
MSIDYHQIAIMLNDEMFNDWEEKNSDQGFTWRPVSVSFGTLQNGGIASVEIHVVDHLDRIAPEAVRVIEVPFDVPHGRILEVATITEANPTDVPEGKYLLRCELFPLTGEYKDESRIVFSFASKDEPRAAIPRADDELRLYGELDMNGFPALPL